MNADRATVRPATRSDLPIILQIEQQAPSASHWSEAEYERILSAQLLLVAETEEAIAGFLCAKHAADEWELDNVAIGAGFRRRGIAGKLLKALMDHMQQTGACIVFLEVRESNLAARRLYEKHGFVETGRRRRYYRSPEEDAVIYRLHI